MMALDGWLLAMKRRMWRGGVGATLIWSSRART
jgi:hypothetical protein